jgi:NAD(P)-dependent dehydrogenase (short-subunit alcohol dehydrogenase family)
MGKLDGRVAIVTGAGRGIGAALVETMAAEGAYVVVNDVGATLDGSGLEGGPAAEVVGRITAAGGVAKADTTDVTDFAAVEALVRDTARDFGRLDVVVNVAGILRDRMIFNMSEDDWDAVIAVHLKGTFNTSRHAATWWREHRGGQYRLINFTSGAGIFGAPSQPNYAAAKMGIVGLTMSCANALAAYGVTANCVAPIAATRMTKGIGAGKALNQYADDDPRMAPANVVPPVVYLASTESGWLSRRIVGAGNGRITLYSELGVARELVASSGVWEVDTAFTEMGTALRRALESPNPFDRKRES